MKNTLIIAALALAFASCKKDYTCTCTNTTTGSSTTSKDIVIYKGVSSGVAKRACVDEEYKDSSGNVTGTSTCELTK